MKRVLALLLTVCMLLGMLTTVALAADAKSKDIVVLYTNDVHCGVDDNIGYAGLAAYKAEMEAAHEYVTLVDNGDAIQGTAIGTMSKGEYLMQIMNAVGYDYATFGNHEFDYNGMAQLQKIIDGASYQYLSCNLVFSGEGEPTLTGYKPYAIEEYGDVKVAFVGVSTPETYTKSTPVYFQDEAGNYIYSFSENDLFGTVQKNVDAARAEGADYVVIMSHLGTDAESEPNRSYDLIAATTGIDVVLDGHSHTVLPEEEVKNKDGEVVLLSSTGDKLQNIGKLVITADGALSTELVSDYEEKDPTVDAFVKDIQADLAKTLEVVVAKSAVDLVIKDENGVRMIRNRETNLGDLVCDAYRIIAGTDIALVSGGGIRDTIPAGDITFGQIIAVHPFNNNLFAKEATGQQILDALEWVCRGTQAEYAKDGNAVGEVGGFFQVSGLTFTIDTTVDSTVVENDKEEFVSVAGARRVKDVKILQDGKYVPIDPKATYTVASTNYTIDNNGDGLTMFTGKPVEVPNMLDNEVLIKYIQDNLGGVVPADIYGEPQGRITVYGSAYTDVAYNAWYADAVNYVTDNKIMNGSGSKFNPDANMTRGQLVTTLYRMAGKPAVEGKVSETFSDCEDGTWYSDAVLWGAENKIVNGSGGKFMPNDPVTREQMVAILYRYAKFMGYDVSVGEDTNILSYNDADKVAEYAISAMQWACGAGIINGSNGNLNPKGNTSRSQCAKVLMELDILAKTAVPAE